MVKNFLNQKNRQKAFKIVMAVINSWDPYGLLASGAPLDEYGKEVSMLIAKLDLINSPTNASKEIANIFSKQFDTDVFTEGSCKNVGEKLFKQLIKAEIISQT